MADAFPTRPPMYQTFIPFVEMYVRGSDILRSSSKKPRSLISFSHDVYAGTGGFWTLEMFDPDYIAVEELFLSTANQATEIAGQAYGGSEGGGTDEMTYPVSTVVFRYGYMGHNEKEVVVAKGIGGEEYYYGTVHAYVPTYQPNGTHLVIRGDSAGARWKRYPTEYKTYTNMSVYDIILEICQQMDWTFVVYGSLENEFMLEYDKQPEDFKRTDSSADSTEEEYPAYKMRDKEDFLRFINRLCLEARPKDSRFDGFVARLEYRAKDKDGQPEGYLFFGPTSYTETTRIVREYVYMRDPRSDIISFSTDAQVWTHKIAGGASLTYNAEDARLGELVVHSLDELSRSMKYDWDARPRATAYTFSEFKAQQQGKPENPKDAEENKAEGSSVGGSTLGDPVKPPQDEPGAEIMVATNDRRAADRQTMNYWLTMQTWVTKASVQIFGDPSREITPGSMVNILVFVPFGPDEAQQMKIHWTSSTWSIIGVSHEIRPGEMVTNLELVRAGLRDGGIATNAVFKEIGASLSPAQRERLGG